jgi:hypothetical protein
MLGSGSVRFKDMVDRFKVYDQPRIPKEKQQVWLGGRKVSFRGGKNQVSRRMVLTPNRLPPIRSYVHPKRSSGRAVFH